MSHPGRRRPGAPGGRRPDPRYCGTQGQATVELALALPVVVIALLMVIQVGLVARTQILVVHAAREGARAASVDPRIGAAAKAARSTPGLRAVALRVSTTGRGVPGGSVRVTVRYNARTDVPLVGRLLGDVELESTVAMRVEDSGA